MFEQLVMEKTQLLDYNFLHQKLMTYHKFPKIKLENYFLEQIVLYFDRTLLFNDKYSESKYLLRKNSNERIK